MVARFVFVTWLVWVEVCSWATINAFVIPVSVGLTLLPSAAKMPEAPVSSEQVPQVSALTLGVPTPADIVTFDPVPVPATIDNDEVVVTLNPPLETIPA